MQFRVIVVTDPPPTNTPTQDSLQYTAPQVARSVMSQLSSKFFKNRCSFCIILLIYKQTNTDKKHKLPGRGNSTFLTLLDLKALHNQQSSIDFTAYCCILINIRDPTCRKVGLGKTFCASIGNVHLCATSKINKSNAAETFCLTIDY